MKSDKSCEIIKQNSSSDVLLDRFKRILQSNHSLDFSATTLEKFENLVLGNLVYNVYSEYSQYVKIIAENMQSLPDSFNSLQDYQEKFKNYIEKAAHFDIKSGWDNLHKENAKYFTLTNVQIQATHHMVLADQIEFKLGVEFNQKDLDVALKSHLHQSVFLLKNSLDPNLEILCMSEATRQSKSSILYLRFRCKKDEFPKYRRLFNRNEWSAAYVTSLVDLSRAYVALGKLSSNECLNRIIDGNISLSPLNAGSPLLNTDKFALNKEQDLLLQRVIAGNDKVNILYGPPGTGKTKTLAALIEMALVNNLRVVVTAPSNQALAELALRLIDKEVKMLVIGDKNKLPESLEISLFAGWKQRLFAKYTQIVCLINNIIQYIASANVNHASSEENNFDELSADYSLLATELNNFSKQLRLSDLVIEKLSQINLPINFLNLDFDVSNNQIYNLNLLHNLKSNLKLLKIKILGSVNDRYIENQLLLQTATTYFATPSTLGRLNLSDIDLVIFDEAGQIPEVNCLPVFAINSQKLVLAGDPRQLSPFTLYADVSRCKFDRSPLFRLINDLNAATTFLKTQYRMPALLSNFISNTFYDSKLETDLSSKTGKHVVRIINNDKEMAFINIASKSQKIQNGHNNSVEAKLIIRFARFIRHKHPNASIGIIAFYVKQSELLNKLLDDSLDIVVSSVDKFQGGESDFIIISGARSDGIGFLNDPARINVALSRAKSGIFFFGNKQNLSQVAQLKSFIDCAEQNGTLYNQNSFTNWLEREEREFHVVTKYSEKADNNTKIKLTNFDKTWAEKIIALLKKHENSPNTDVNLPTTSLEEKIIRFENLKEELTSEYDAFNLKLQNLQKELELLKNQEVVIKKRFHDITNPDVLKIKQDCAQLSDKINENQNLIANINFNLDSLKHSVFFKKQQLQKFMQYKFSEIFNENYSCDYTELLEIAVYTSDNVLRSAIFCRLSYIALANGNHWEALFFAYNILYLSLNTKCITEKKYLNLYEELVAVIIEKSTKFVDDSLNFNYFTAETPGLVDKDSNIDINQEEITAQTRRDLFKKIVQAFKDYDSGILPLKFDSISTLIKCYKKLRYFYAFDYIEKLIDNLDVELKYRTDNKLSQIAEIESFKSIRSYFNSCNISSDFIHLKELDLNDNKNLKIARFSQFNICKNLIKFSHDCIESYYSDIKKILAQNNLFANEYLYVCYELIQLLMINKKTFAVIAIAEELKQLFAPSEKSSSYSFMLSWIFYTCDIYLQNLQSSNYLVFSRELIVEILYLSQSQFLNKQTTNNSSRFTFFDNRTAKDKIPELDNNQSNLENMSV